MALLEAESPSAPMSLPQRKGSIQDMRVLEEVTLDYHILDYRTMITSAELYRAGTDILALHRLQDKREKNNIQERLPGGNIFNRFEGTTFNDDGSPYNVQVLKGLEFDARLPRCNLLEAHKLYLFSFLAHIF